MSWLITLIKVPYLGFVILMLPYMVLMSIALVAIRYSVQGGSRRLVGFFGCPVLGAVCVGIGWWVAYIGFPEDSIHYVAYPVAGWIGIVLGSICILFGTLYSIFGSGELLKEITSSPEQGSSGISKGGWESQDEQILYIGDSETGLYHERSCMLVEEIKHENMVGFRSAYEAEKSGYTFCSLCESKES